MRHTLFRLFCFTLIIGLVCPIGFAQETSGVPLEDGLSLETIQHMPLQRIDQNGDLFLQRSRSDVERIVGFIAGQSSGLEEKEKQWIGYLEKPHPSVSVMRRYFAEAAQEFDIPAELLEAIGQVESNWAQVGPSIDRGWGVMHLVQNEYIDTLTEAANVLGVTQQALKDDARQNIRGAAALLAKYAGEDRKDFTTFEAWFDALKRFSALDGDEWQSMQAERYLAVVKDGISKPTLWNEQVELAAHPSVNLQALQKLAKQPVRSADYSPAKSYYYSSCTYTAGRSRKIDTWVNHWIGYGTYAGAISYLSRCSVKASAHFVIKQNGEITQTVRVRDTAWHAGARGYPNNSRSIGIEHEAVITDPTSWNHPAMLKASAQMARYFADKYGIPKRRALPGIRGHNEMPGTSTACPGNLPWTTWMNYLKGTAPAAPKLTSGIHVFTNNPSSQAVEYGQWMEASFKVKNYGGKSITFRRLGVIGRAPSTNGGTNPTVVCDFRWKTNVTLKPNEERYVSVSTKNFGCGGKWGTYRLSPYYQLPNGNWHKIPTGASGTRTDYRFKVVQHAAPVRLSNGVARTDYVPRNGYDRFYLDVPVNTTKLTITTTQARSGNYLNLYENAGSDYPTSSSYSHKAASDSSNETLTIINPAAGRHTIFIDGYYNGGSERGTPYAIAATWENPTTPTSKSLRVVSDPGTYIEEMGRGAVAARVSPYWNTSLVDPAQHVLWLWSSYDPTISERINGATRTFREPFSIPQGARNIRGTINITADDRFKLYLNGSKIAENGDHRYIRQYSFTPVVGQNMMKIQAINAPGSTTSHNPGGVIYRADISYDFAHRLTVEKNGSGSGTVNGIGISCGEDCSEEFGDGNTVTLSANAAPGSIFTGWSGACSGTGDCSITMKSAATVKSTFSRTTHTMTASAGPGGEITPSGSLTLDHGADQTFTIEPEAGYQVATLLVDGKTVNETQTYTFTNVTSDHTIKVYFKQAEYTIAASAGEGGTISPNREVSVTHGANQDFTIAPDPGYRIADVLVDGSSVGNLSSYSFENVNADHSIAVSFELIPVDAVTLTIDDAQGKPGTLNVPVTIALDTASAEVASMQFRIRYDSTKGVHAVGGNAGYKLSSRTHNFSASVVVSENGEQSEALVLLYNMSGESLAAGDGPILELLFHIDETAVPDAQSLLTFTECTVADKSAQAVPADSSDTARLTIEQPYELGDINTDGDINVLDLQQLLNCITTSNSCERCDLNGDNLHNVLDVQVLINLINNVVPETPSSGEPSLTSSGLEMLRLPHIQIQPDTSGTFGLEMVNDGAVASGQLTLMYDSTTGFDITGVNVTERTQGFDEPVIFSKDDSDPASVKVFVLFFSLQGAAIEAGVGDILEFNYQTSAGASGSIDLAIVDSLFAAQDGSAHAVTTESGAVMLEDETLYTLTAYAGSGGAISPAGSVWVKAGADRNFDMIVEEGYHIEEVLVDGISEGALTNYTFMNVNADHLIEVRFAADAGEVSSYFGFDEFGGIWNDAEKSLENTEDDWMCWAAAASNILEWTGWGTELFESAQEIFTEFQNSWTNAGGLMEYGWRWWFDGTEPPAEEGWAQLNEGWANAEEAGGYWNGYNVFDYFYEDWAWDFTSGQWADGSGLLDTIDSYLHSGYGVSLAVYNESGGHALSVWGCEYDEFGDYIGVWVTDSDDYVSDLKLLTVSLNSASNLWYLDTNNLYDYQGWFIGGVQALDQRTSDAVPEPSTFLLIGFGLLLGLIVKRRAS